MTTRASEVGAPIISTTKSLIGGRGFDRAMIIAGSWMLIGGFLDAWAHNNIPSLETFFTPWHGILYSGFLVVAATMVGAVFINHRRGYSWQQSIPAGYELSLLAVAGFALGGIGDMCWHLIFGIENNLDAALSPTHLILTVCIGLLVAGPYRALYRRRSQMQGWQPQLMLIFSTLLVLLPFTLITQVANPFNSFWPTYATNADDAQQTLAVISIIFQTTILMGLVLITMRRWRLPVGFFTIIYTLSALLLSFMHSHFLILPVVFVAGIASDAVYYWLKPSLARITELRLFAFLAPVLLYSAYFIALQITSGLVWTIHLAGGSIVIAGITGWLLTYILFLPQAATSENIDPE